MRLLQESSASGTLRRICSATAACTPSPRRGVVEAAGWFAKRNPPPFSPVHGGLRLPPLLVELRRTWSADPPYESHACHAAFACTVSQNSARRPARRSVAGLAPGEAISATSVLLIGAKP